MIITRPTASPQATQHDMLQKVFTVGYRQADGLAEIARRMQDDPACILVDIRYNPTSKQNPEWTQQAFSRKYQTRYKWIQDLGNKRYKERGKIEIADPTAGIEQLLLLLEHHSIILMCGCENYDSCHRKVVYQLLTGVTAAQEAKHSAPEIIATRHNGPAPLYPAGSIQERIFNELLEALHTEQAENYEYRELIAELVQYTLENGLADDQEEIYEIIRERLRDDRNEHSQATEKVSSRSKRSDQGTRRAINEEIGAYHSSTENYHPTGGDNQDTQEQEQRNVRRLTHIQKHDRRSGIHNQGTSGGDSTNQTSNADTAEVIERAKRKLTQALRIVKKARSREQQAHAQAARQKQQIETLILKNAQLRQGKPTIGGLTTHELRDLYRVSSKQLGTAQKLALPFIIEAFQNGIEYGEPQPYDTNGLRRMNCGSIGAQIGVDASTISRCFDFLETQLPEHFSIDHHNENVVGVKKPVPRIYFKPKDIDVLKRPKDLTPSEDRKHGGDRYAGLICNKCESDHYEVIRKTKTTDVFHCLDCNNISIMEESEKEKTIYTQAGTGGKTPITIKKQLAFYSEDDPTQEKAPELNGNLQVVITSNPPLHASTEHHPQNNQLAVAKLLLAIAGQHEKHIVMPMIPSEKNPESKYLEVVRTLTLGDVMNHLRGGEARGAPCSYENDETWSLCWDADDITTWIILEQAAALLVVAGYLPILEESPADRGGHLWVIFTARVNATQAREHVYSIAPDLRHITEFWPAPPDAKKWNRVRLPGGFYNRHGEEPVKGWCKLVAVASKQECKDGKSNAVLLLANQTPITVIVATSRQDREIVEATATRVEQPAPIVTAAKVSKREQYFIELEQKLGYPVPRVDEKWEKDNGPIESTTWYFAIMPNVAARYFNRYNPLVSIQPLERNKKALSPNGSERTASTDYYVTEDGERYTDFSNNAKRSDGTHDTGDALELAVKIWNKPKWQIIADTRKEMSRKGKIELESAARAGIDIPEWLQEPDCILTPAGRKHYADLLQTPSPIQAEQTPAAPMGTFQDDSAVDEFIARMLAAGIPEEQEAVPAIDICDICHTREAKSIYGDDKKYCKTCEPQPKIKSLGVKCEICRYNEAMYIWSEGKKYCNTCKAKEEHGTEQATLL